ncbi:hypothetical protein DAEQUDRAFT_727320 [Daedalea quercina L-15889]|uniref:Uncharacterized protein n=1 Tax=Daedalea quercina L-15889 TaxID=1314783 RepID=A0A165Q1H7_9APHY|nr:hypothetical protein DAEQUDRAFT_727320 [Daedalea quercina L-15889]
MSASQIKPHGATAFGGSLTIWGECTTHVAGASTVSCTLGSAAKFCHQNATGPLSGPQSAFPHRSNDGRWVCQRPSGESYSAVNANLLRVPVQAAAREGDGARTTCTAYLALMRTEVMIPRSRHASGADALGSYRHDDSHLKQHFGRQVRNAPPYILGEHTRGLASIEWFVVEGHDSFVV